MRALQRFETTEEYTVRRSWTPVVITSERPQQAATEPQAATFHPLRALVAPFAGLAFIVALPVIGLALLAATCFARVSLAGVRRFIRNAAMLAAAPFIGLAYMLAMPFVGCGVLVVMAAKACAKTSENSALARTIRGAALVIAAPFIGLAYAVAMPFIGFGAMAWVGARSTRRAA